MTTQMRRTNCNTELLGNNRATTTIQRYSCISPRIIIVEYIYNAKHSSCELEYSQASGLKASVKVSSDLRDALHAASAIIPPHYQAVSLVLRAHLTAILNAPGLSLNTRPVGTQPLSWTRRSASNLTTETNNIALLPLFLSLRAQYMSKPLGIKLSVEVTAVLVETPKNVAAVGIHSRKVRLGIHCFVPLSWRPP